MNTPPEVATGSIWTVDDEFEESCDGSDNSLSLSRLVDATHTGVHSLAFASAIMTNTVT